MSILLYGSKVSGNFTVKADKVELRLLKVMSNNYAGKYDSELVY
jgi:hypothetical protein